MARTKASDGGPTMADMVRAALNELGSDAKPTPIQDYIKTKFDKDVSKIIISNYKSNMKKKGGTGKRRGRPPGSGKQSVDAAPAIASAGGKGIRLEDLAAVRGLVGRLGATQLRQLVDVLA
jgi:hypothetical protein